MIVRQFFDPESSTYTYLLVDARSGDAMIIDSVRERMADYDAAIAELGCKLVVSAETHTHADHITAAALLQQKYGCDLLISKSATAPCATRYLADGEVVRVGALEVKALATPGHTADGMCYLAEDRLFTGDTLFIGGCGRTDFQSGDAGTLYDVVTGKLFTLPDDTLVYPGHDYNGNTVSTVRQEKAKNPRLGGGKTRSEFIAIMGALNLAPPKKIAEALPANERCGAASQAQAS